MITTQALIEIEAHWAIQAMGDDAPRALARASELHVEVALAPVLEQSPASADDIALIDRVATAYELAALDGLAVLLRPFVSEDEEARAQQVRAGAYRAFELLRALPLPEEIDMRVFAVLHLAALGYCGERWTDARRWLTERDIHSHLWTAVEDTDAQWDQHLLRALYSCWVALLRKEGWQDLAAIEGAVATLREQQQTLETELLTEQSPPVVRKGVALKLLALYHWAKATEVLARYMTTGRTGASGTVQTVLDQHFEASASAAAASGDLELDFLLRWLHVAAREMASGSLWSAAGNAGDAITRFIEHVTQARGIIEFLPPQRAALKEQGLLDQASRAVVVELPTSGGKTALAEFRMLQALEFGGDDAWVAYVAPTRALVAQVERRLRADFSPLGIEVAALSAAVEVDAFERGLLAEEGALRRVNVLVATPEKLDMVIRNELVARPLALVVMDEAHNIEEHDRGLGIELLLATIKHDSPNTRFLLLMPFVPNADDLARWLAPDASRTISLGASAWQPNEQIVVVYSPERLDDAPGNWRLRMETLVTTRGSVTLSGSRRVGPDRPVDKPYSGVSLTATTAAMAKVFSERGTSIGVARTLPDTWTMARLVENELPELDPVPDAIGLVQRFLKTEVDPEFELVRLLKRGIGVHHSGLSDEARSLIEWLAETSELRVLCATTGISQGIDFPVSSVFLATRQLPTRPAREMTRRAFWNLAGRAGRLQHDSVGVVGLAAGNDPAAVKQYVVDATGDLVSHLEQTLKRLWEAGTMSNLEAVIHSEEWASFRTYVAHLWRQKRELEAVLAETEQLLRNTLGYSSLKSSSSDSAQSQAAALLEATRKYATSLADHSENAVLADSTGFSPEGVRSALLDLQGLEDKPRPDEWTPTSLFSESGQPRLAALIGVMLRVPELNSLGDLVRDGEGRDTIARIAQAWVNGDTIGEIAQEFFASGHGEEALTSAISDACRGIYRQLGYAGTWGLAALSKLPTTGIDYEAMNEEERRLLNQLPAMLYHGVRTEAGVLMRMNSVPRSVAEALGEHFEEASGKRAAETNPHDAREFVASLEADEWAALAPQSSHMSGADYRTVWRHLSGTES